MEAISSDQPEAARLLLKRGADPSLSDSNDFTPLMVAARRGHTVLS